MNKKTSFMTKIAILTAIATILYQIEIPMLFGHLKVDPSLIPSLVAGIWLGPVAGVTVEVLKNLIDLPMSTSAGIGQLINVVVGTSVILPMSILYRKNSTTKGFIIAGAVSLVSIVTFGALCNYLLTPAFLAVLGRPEPTHAEIMVYVAASVSLNITKLFVTLIPTYFLIPALNKAKSFA